MSLAVERTMHCNLVACLAVIVALSPASEVLVVPEVQTIVNLEGCNTGLQFHRQGSSGSANTCHLVPMSMVVACHAQTFHISRGHDDILRALVCEHHAHQ